MSALSFLMRRAGHRVRTTTNGADTLVAVGEEIPDLLLLDVMMPRSNGYDVCKALRAQPECDGVRIVMLTARGGANDQHTGLALGADAYVTKPFAISEVVECVADLLARDRRPSRET